MGPPARSSFIRLAARQAECPPASMRDTLRLSRRISMKPSFVALSSLVVLCACAAPETAGALAVPAPAGAARPATGAGKRAFELADVYRVKQVGSPALSPDGKLVAFQVRRTDLAADKAWSEIWLMNTDGTNQRQMTRGEHMDTGPLFTPDGASLVFSSNRADPGQLYVMPIDGGEPRQLTKFPTGVADPVFSPDGKLIAVSADRSEERRVGKECRSRW